MSEPAPRVFRWVVLLAIATAIWVVAFTAASALLSALTSSLAAASTVAFLTVGLGMRPIERSPRLDEAIARAPRAARVAFTIGTLAVAVQLAWLVPFIIDPNRATWSASPSAPMPSVHSCVSSYWVAAQRVTEVPNVYAEVLYSLPQTDPTARRTARKLGPLQIDNFEYPPPFLLASRFLGSVTADFWSFRRLWFGLNFAIVALAAVAVARRLDARLGTHAVWLVPFVIAGPATIATLQVGNVQLAVIAITLLAMYWIDRGAHAAGGALLAVAIVAKLYPGVFVLYLLLRHEWRPVIWTAIFGLALVAVSLADVGLQPYRAFVHEMPALMSGEAFSAFRSPIAIGNNGSVPGLVFKLKMWGVPYMGYDAMRIVGWVYTLVVVACTVWLARRVRPGGREPVLWLVIVVLATMRSPFMATYAFFPVMWLATLVAALAWRESRTALAVLLAWCALALTFGAGGPLAPPVNAVWTTVQTVLTFVLLVAVLRQLRAREPAAEPEPGLAAPARA